MTRQPVAQQQTATTSPLSNGGILQRQCGKCGQHAIAGEECGKCEKKHLSLQRQATHQSALREIPPIIREVLNSPGQNLDTATQSYMSSHFNYDFSQVKVHNSPQASASAQAVNALAYTVNRDIVFGANQYSPTTVQGRRLLAHELTHVIQQGISGGVSAESSATEAEAEANALSIVNNATPSVSQGAPVGIARQPTGKAERSLGEQVFNAAIQAVTSRLPGGGMPAQLMSAAMYGFGSEMYHQLTDDKQISQFKAALAELVIPANAVDFVTSYTSGAIAGLVSPVTDLLGLAALGEQMPIIAANLAKNTWEKSSESVSEASQIGNSIAQLKSQVLAFAMLDAMEDRAKMSARTAGSGAAKKVIAYFSGKDEEPSEGETATKQESLTDALLTTKPEEKAGITSFITSKFTRSRKALFKAPWQKIGYNIGYAVGAIVVNVLLLAATEGIGNLIVEVSAGLGKLSPLLSGAEKALVGLGTRIAEVEKAIAALLGTLMKPLSGATKWMEPLLKPLEELMSRLSGFVRKLLGLPEKAAAKATAQLGAHLGNDAAEKLAPKVSPQIRPKAPGIAEPVPVPKPKSSPQLLPTDSHKGGALIHEPPHPTSPSVEIKAPKKAQELVPPKEPPITKPQPDPAAATTWVKENPKVITGEPGHRRASVGGGHEIVEVPDPKLPSGIGCELHSPPPHVKVPCPNGMGSKSKETIEQFKQRGGEVKIQKPGEMPKKSPSEVVAVSEPKPPEGFEDLNVPSRTEKQAGVRVAEDHHVATRYRQENKKLFEKIGFDIDDDFNLIKDFKDHGELRGWEEWDSTKKVYVHQQRGHHPEYNNWVTDKVKSSIKGLRGTARRAAFKSAVEEIASIVEKYPEVLAYGPKIFTSSKVPK
jgi:hypothetical protein